MIEENQEKRLYLLCYDDKNDLSMYVPTYLSTREQIASKSFEFLSEAGLLSSRRLLLE